MSDLSDSTISISSDEEEDQVARVIPNRRDPFVLYNDREFKLRYRFSKENVIHIKNQLGNLEPATHRNKALCGMLQLLLALRFYATGSFQQLLGDNINVSRSTACRVIRKVSNLIAALKPNYIYMPRQDEIANVKTEFYSIGQFPGVIGAIDCTHVRIRSPGGDYAEQFRNRKGYFSLNIQAVCDTKLKIRNIISRWPGSVHDSAIFNDSPLRADLEAGNYGANTWILGDNEYACKSYLLTPLLHPATPSEEAYNRSHVSTRNTVERAFGVLKRRFPCLHTGLRNKLTTAVVIVVACAVLHNMAVDLCENDFDDTVNETAEADLPPNPQNVRDANVSVRTALILNLF